MTTNRIRTFSDSPYEQQFGFCRAIRVGNQIIVSGTIGIENGELVGIGDAYQQTVVAFKNILVEIEAEAIV